MNDPMNNLRNYYGDPDQYLAEHADFFKKHTPSKDVDFLIKALAIQEHDAILDIACGQGRHATEFARRGYTITGVDFSDELIQRAIEASSQTTDSSQPSYFVQDIESLKLKQQFDTIYWFFPDFANINLQRAVTSITAHLKEHGRILIDGDNLFRIVRYLQTHADSPYSFDPKRLELIDDASNLKIPYPTFGMWEQWLKENGLTITETWGGIDSSPYSITSDRLILVAKK